MLVALLLVVLVVAVLLHTLWRAARGRSSVDAAAGLTQANAQVYREQLQELEREHAQGLLSDTAFASAQEDLQRRLLEDVSEAPAASASAEVLPSRPWALTWALGLVIPLAALLLYASFGQPQALDPRVLAQGTGPQNEVTPEKLAEMAQGLARRLQDEPNNAEGWLMLARVQRARGLFDEADVALTKVLALTQDDEVQIERAEVLAQKAGGRFAGEPWAIIQRVLARDPQHLNALLLAGSASFTEGNAAAALKFWERARTHIDPASPDASELDRAMAQARDKLGLPPLPVADAGSPKPAAASSVGSISGRVTLTRELASRVAPTDTVFVYATAVSGSKMPLAMLRTTADKLPLDFVLDDSMAMAPGMKLSDQAEVTLRVRISKSGQAKAQPGDLGVSLSPVKPGAKGLDLTVRDALR